MHWSRFVRAGLGFGSSKRAYMTVKYSDGRPDEVRRLSVSDTAEVTIQIEERDGQQFIVIREQNPNEPVSSQSSVEIPAALLPEFKRAVSALEQNIGDDPQSPDTT